MTFDLLGNEFAPSILDIHPEPGIVPTRTPYLVRLVALDPSPARQRRLACKWRRQLDGRIACTWEPDIVLIPLR